MSKKTFILRPFPHPSRENAARAIRGAPDGYVVRISEPEKKRGQEEKYHCQIEDIARQTEYAGKRWDEEDTKRILVDEFAEEMRNCGEPLHGDSRLIPSENGRRVIQLGIQTRKFYVKEASQFISFLYAWGDMRGVKWSEPRVQE